MSSTYPHTLRNKAAKSYHHLIRFITRTITGIRSCSSGQNSRAYPYLVGALNVKT